MTDIAAPTGATMDFVDYVSRGLELRQSRDNTSWKLGDLVVDFEVTLGRPTDPDAPKLSDLAAAWDVDLPRMSEWRNVAKFYPANVRMNELSWSHHNMARRASDGTLDSALELLDAARRLHLGVEAFRQYLNNEYFKGEVGYAELPDRLRGFVPTGASVWLVMKRKAEG